MKKEEKTNIVISFILGALVAGSGVYFGMSSKKGGSDNEYISRLIEADEVIAREASGTMDYDKAVDGFISGGLDQWSRWLDDGNEIKSMTNYVNTSGTALASGFSIDIADDGNILVTNAEEGLAAYNSGIRTGDKITMIAGNDVAATGYEHIANKLLGKKDTTVELTIDRDSEKMDIVFKRDHYYVYDVEQSFINDDIGYIKVKDYDNFATDEFRDAVKNMLDCKGIIIDLRNNMGGVVESAVDMCGYFCRNGSVVLHGEKIEDRTVTTPEQDYLLTAKVVILVNDKTMSSAEIQAAIMKEYYSDTVLVGTQTGGKGVFQQNVKLESGGTLRFTAGYTTVGDMECWNGVGITPDVVVEMDEELIGTDKDTQLKKAIDLLS